jgi:hypothetical protein
MQLEQCDFFALLFVLIMLPPRFVTVNKHPFVLQEMKSIEQFVFDGLSPFAASSVSSASLASTKPSLASYSSSSSSSSSSVATAAAAEKLTRESKCLSLFLPLDSVRENQMNNINHSNEQTANSHESSTVFQYQLPSNVMVRWAFGGFGYDEWHARLKDKVRKPKQLRDLFDFVQLSLFEYAFEVCVHFYKSRFLSTH